MSSVDGRLLDNRWTQPFGETDKTELLKVYAAIGRELNTDAWMFGKTRFALYFLKIEQREYPLLRNRFCFHGRAALRENVYRV